MIQTINVHNSKGKELKFSCDDSVPKVDLEWLRDFFEESIKNGRQYSVGELIQIGSNVVKIVELDGFLQLEEPDMASEVINFVPGVTRTLKMLRVQRDVCASFDRDESIQFPSIRESAIVCNKLNGHDFFMERIKPKGTDSGWFLGCLQEHEHNDPSLLQRASIYQILVNVPKSLPFLALPPGVTVINDNGIKASENGVELIPQKGSFVDLWSMHDVK